MKRSCHLGVIGVVALAVVAFLVTPAPLLAAKFPEKPITIIVPVSPGGVTDITARLFAMHLSRVWGVPVNVENHPGGSSVIGTLELNKARPDGYTVMMDSKDSTSLPAALENIPFNILDRTWMNTIADNLQLLLVPQNSKFKTLQDVIDAMRADPTHFRIPSMVGIGTQDFFMRQFAKAIGVDHSKLIRVMGKGGGDIVILTLQGSVDVGQLGLAAARTQLESKAMRALGITGEKRLDWLPDVPTFAELGYPQVTAVFWVGLSAPPKTPKAVVETWNETVRKLVLEDKDFQAVLDKACMRPRWRNQEETIEYVKAQMAEAKQLWGRDK